MIGWLGYRFGIADDDVIASLRIERNCVAEFQRQLSGTGACGNHRAIGGQEPVIRSEPDKSSVDQLEVLHPGAPDVPAVADKGAGECPDETTAG